MNEEILRIEAKMRKDSPIDAEHWKSLTTAERETYADHLASRGHFRSAALFTTDEAKKAEFEKQIKY